MSRNQNRNGKNVARRETSSNDMQEVGDLEIGKLGAFLMIKLNCVSNDGERFAESSGYSVRGVVVPRHLKQSSLPLEHTPGYRSASTEIYTRLGGFASIETYTRDLPPLEYTPGSVRSAVV